MPGPLVTQEVIDGIAVITLNRPEKMNALTGAMVQDLLSALEGAEADPSVHAAVIRGAGRAFSTGHDLEELASRMPDSSIGVLAEQREQLANWMAIWDLSLPVVAAVHGYCLGAGFEIALHCDFIVAASDAQFGYPTVRGGIPDTQMFAFRMGVQWAKRVLFSGDSIDASTAERIGLVLATVAPDALDREAYALAQSVGQVPRPYMRGMKRVLNGVVQRAGLEDAAAEGHVEFALAREPLSGRSASDARPG
jgi:enoyl-CoA hydratase